MALFFFDVIIWIALGPYPSDAQAWYSLLASSRPVGLLLLSFPTFFGMMLYCLTFLALYAALRAINQAWSGLAAFFAVLGLATLIITSSAYPLAFLSDSYAGAATEQQRQLLLAAGEVKIATAVPGAHLGGFLAEGAALLFSVLMLRSGSGFGKPTAWLGIVGHGLDFVRIIMILAFIPEELSSVLLWIGGLPQLLWQVLVARRLLQLGSALRG